MDSEQFAVNITSLTAGQYDIVYNLFSLTIASMLFTALYLLLSQRRVAPRYRNAVVISAIVCGIAAYHYFRIFSNFQESYPPGESVASDHELSNVVFNEAYRYVDWLLTVPLLLVETVAVMALARAAQRALLVKLIPAATAMIVLGYPGEIATTDTARIIWGILATLPFLYIVYVLFTELYKSLDRQPARGAQPRQVAAGHPGRAVVRLPDRIHVPDHRRRVLRRRRRFRPASGRLQHR